MRDRVDIRYLPGQDPGRSCAEVGALPDLEVVRSFTRVPAMVSRTNPFVRALGDAVRESDRPARRIGVGRDGASDAISFLEAGVPAVEFGPPRRRPPRPRGVGVDVLAGRATAERSSTSCDELPARLEGTGGLRAVEGGLA